MLTCQSLRSLTDWMVFPPFTTRSHTPSESRLEPFFMEPRCPLSLSPDHSDCRRLKPTLAHLLIAQLRFAVYFSDCFALQHRSRYRQQ